MSLAAGTITLVSVGQSTASLSLTAATGGTSPYAYQWYRSTTSGFSPGAGNIITGATALTLNDSALIPGTTYFYKNVVTDSASPNATATATQLSVLTSNPTQSQNQFALTQQVGSVDMPFNFNTHPVLIDVSQVGTIYAGCAVKIVGYTSNGVAANGGTGVVPRVVACSADSDSVFGFLNYDIKNVGWVAGNAAEVSLKGNIMYLYATAACTQGTQLQLDLSTNGGVTENVGSSGACYVGWAYDGAAAAGALIRVYIETPSFKTF